MFKFNKNGTALLFVIVGITMAAAIGFGMFYMTSTSTLGQASGSGMNRAYYLAMAGKDYALANWDKISRPFGPEEFIVSNKERFELTVNDLVITSTGIVSDGSPFESRKEIKFAPPSPAKRHFLDTFENLDNWETSSQVGSQTTATVDGDKALDVASSPDGFGVGSGTWGFLELKVGSGGAFDIIPSWLNAGRSLSYDLQVKISNSEPLYMAGLTFKVDNTGNEFYGVSYLRAKRRCGLCFSDICWNSSCIDDIDNIPVLLKPSSASQLYLFGGSPTTGWSDSLETLRDGSKWIQYSKPSIVLWKRYLDTNTGEYTFTWLAYKILKSTDYVVDSSGYLKDWSNLQVRLIEAYPLNFTTAGTSSTSPLLSGAIVVGPNGSARISGTPVITSGSWASSDVVGTLTLTNKSGTFSSGENLLVNGTILAKASGILGSKTNFIRAYFADVNSHGALNDIPTDSDNRGENQRIVTGSEAIRWPVDNMRDWKSENDYMTLVQWDGVKAPALRLGGSGGDAKEGNAIIEDGSLLTPDSGVIDYSGIALHATGSSAAFTYFDDFAVQY